MEIALHNAATIEFSEPEYYQDASSGEWWTTTKITISNDHEKLGITLFSPRAKSKDDTIRFSYDHDEIHRLAQENLELRARLAMIEEMVTET